MADENETGPAIEGAETLTPVVAVEPKKQRKPRQKKVIAEAASPVSPIAAVKSLRKKREARSVDTTADTTQIVSKSKPGRARKADPQPKAATPLPAAERASDEMADLIMLEAENKRLRQALAEKLRAENADLRKKLGQAL